MAERAALRADVAVVGLGSIGVMAAWRIAATTGMRVLGFEQYGRVHPHASYAGESRLFRAAYHEGALYVPLLLRARELWQQLFAVSGADVFLPTGALSIAEAGRPELDGVLESIREFDLPNEVLDRDQLKRRFPQHAYGESDVGILDLLGGALRPELAVSAAHDQALANGALLFPGEGVTAIEEQDDGVHLVTTRRRVHVDRVVVATGAWASQLVPQLSDQLSLRRLLLTWFLPRHLRDFSPEVFPAFIRDRGDVHLFGAPVLDGLGVKVSTTDRWGTDGVEPDISSQQLAEFGESVTRLLPDLYPYPVRYSVHRDAYTADRNPIVDLVPGSERVIVAAGFSGHGFKLSPAIGELIAEMCSGRRVDAPQFPWPPALGTPQTLTRGTRSHDGKNRS